MTLTILRAVKKMLDKAVDIKDGKELPTFKVNVENARDMVDELIKSLTPNPLGGVRVPQGTTSEDAQGRSVDEL